MINQEIDQCEVFVLVMHRRWGQEAPDSDYDSYTEEEFHRALARRKEEQKPEIIVYFKRVDPASEADPGDQLKKVLAFRLELEESRMAMYRWVEDCAQFGREVNEHLRRYAKGDYPSIVPEHETTLLPIETRKAVEKERKETQAALEKARQAEDETEKLRLELEKAQLEIAEDAAKFALEGMVERARQKFIKLASEATNLRILYLCYEFFERVGEFALAEDSAKRCLELSGETSRTANTAAAYGNLGLIYRARGELDEAEEMFRKSLDLNKELGRKEGMAIHYENLGSLYQKRAKENLDEKEQFLAKTRAYWQEAIKLYEYIGSPDAKEVRASLDELDQEED